VGVKDKKKQQTMKTGERKTRDWGQKTLRSKGEGRNKLCGGGTKWGSVTEQQTTASSTHETSVRSRAKKEKRKYSFEFPDVFSSAFVGLDAPTQP
jgi:hypothetical protein